MPIEAVVALKTLSQSKRRLSAVLSDDQRCTLVEAMAQAAGILGFYSQGKTIDEGSTYYLAGADNVRFKRPCVPGDRVMLSARVLSVRRGIWKFEVRAEVEGEQAAGATILCADR